MKGGATHSFIPQILSTHYVLGTDLVAVARGVNTVLTSFHSTGCSQGTDVLLWERGRGKGGDRAREERESAWFIWGEDRGAEAQS